MTEYTPNFRFNLPDFREGPWHDLVNINTERMDQLLMSLYGGSDTQPWANNTYYALGTTAIDLTDNSFWVSSVSHTSAGVPTTFAQDRIAHPTYWARVVVGIAARGDWQNDTQYLANDLVTDPVEEVIALCKTPHISSAAPATIRDDVIYWTFIADLHAVIPAQEVTYTSAYADDVQEALDEIYASLVDTINHLVIAENDIQDLETRVGDIESTGYVTEAPMDALIYGRKSGIWFPIDQVVGPPGADSTVPGPQGPPGPPGPASTVPGPPGEVTEAELTAAIAPKADTTYVDTKNALDLKVAGGQTTTGGFRFTSYNAGILTAGQTLTPNAYNGNYQYYTNNGAHTIAVPANDSALDVLVTNGATAGAITFSGYTVGSTTGDALTTTNTHKFIISIRRINSISTYVIKALQ